MKKVYPAQLEQMIAEGAIYIERLQEGFDNYPYEILELEADDYERLLRKAVELNGEEHSYFDFYFSRLTDESKELFRKQLCGEEMEAFRQIEMVDNSVYYPLREDLIPFVHSITSRELLFSTFYFTKYPCTIWGNYNLKYPLFYKEGDTLTQKFLREIKEEIKAVDN